MSLAELARRCSTCTACALSQGRQTVVFGEGLPDAEVMIVGEAPGGDEDASGRPFVGRAGQLLDKILEAAAIPRAELYITNIVKCRPPQNRTPSEQEADTCWQWLEQQIDLIRPQIIVTMGNVPTQRFLHTSEGITKLRGVWREWQGIKVFPMFHPSFLLRNPSRAPGGPKSLTWTDIKELKAAMDQLGPKPEQWRKPRLVQESLFG
ncbi:MAG: uracil-DNA glycosylase [Deinococcus sp.]|nr:uracil-DNA glycosylase [Deinococcus sp.]